MVWAQRLRRGHCLALRALRGYASCRHTRPCYACDAQLSRQGVRCGHGLAMRAWLAERAVPAMRGGGWFTCVVCVVVVSAHLKAKDPWQCALSRTSSSDQRGAAGGLDPTCPPS